MKSKILIFIEIYCLLPSFWDGLGTLSSVDLKNRRHVTGMPKKKKKKIKIRQSTSVNPQLIHFHSKVSPSVLIGGFFFSPVGYHEGILRILSGSHL